MITKINLSKEQVNYLFGLVEKDVLENHTNEGREIKNILASAHSRIIAKEMETQ